MQVDLQTAIVRTDGRAVLVVRGEVDTATAPQLEDSLVQLVAITDRAVLDFSDVTFLDSSGISVLIRVSQRSSTTDIVIRNASDHVTRILEISGLADRFLESR